MRKLLSLGGSGGEKKEIRGYICEGKQLRTIYALLFFSLSSSAFCFVNITGLKETK